MLQCIITSYQRPAYLEKCLRSMREGARGGKTEIMIGVVDGGSRDGPCTWNTEEIIRECADAGIFMEDNPGADVLKNEGIEAWVTEPYFLCSSDDFLYPAGWADLLIEQWRKVNGGILAEPGGFAMLASPTERIVEEHYPLGHYDRVNGIELMPTGISMVAGTIMDTAAVRAVGGFPVYGKTGQGDIAISRELRAKGFKVGYFRNPVLHHLGSKKEADYPEYSAAFAADDEVWQRRARHHVVTKA